MQVSIYSILNDMVHLCIQVSVPPKLNHFICEEDLDVDSTCSDGEEEDFGFNESYCPGSSTFSNTDDGSAMGVNASVQPDEDDQSNEDNLVVLNSRNSHRWCNKWLKMSESQTTVITQ